MQIHELSFAMQRDRERDLSRTLTTRRLLVAGGHLGSRGPGSWIRGLLRRPSAPVVRATPATPTRAAARRA